MRPLSPRFQPPGLHKVIPRPRLYLLLQEDARNPFIWVGAPAGYGKTTLVASFIQKSEIPSLWYRIDRTDENPDEFLQSLFAGLQGLFHPDKHHQFPSFPDHHSVDPERFLTGLIAALPNPFFIVFDHYDRLIDDSKIHTLLSTFDERMPAGICLIFLSSHSPPPAFARALAHQSLNCISADQLRFSLEETSELILRHTGKRPNPGKAREIHQQCQGWPAGIILLLKSGMAFSKHPSLPIQENPVAVFDYFAHEIYHRLDPTQRHILLRTALFEDIDPVTLDEICETPGAHTHLKELIRKGCFIEYRPRHDTFVLHPLFRRFLLNLAVDTLGKESWRNLHRKAGNHFAAQGRNDSALECFIEAAEFSKALELFDKQADHYHLPGHGMKLQRQLARFPPDWSRTSPRFAYWNGISKKTGQPEAALQHFEHAFVKFSQRHNPSRAIQTCVAAIDLFMSHLQHLDRLPVWLERLRKVDTNRSDIPHRLKTERILSLFQGHLLVAPHTTGFKRWRDQLIQQLHNDPSPDLWGRVCPALLLYEYWRGRFSQVRLWLERLQMLINEHTTPPDLAILCHNFAANLCWHQQLDIQSTRENVEKGLACIDRHHLMWPKGVLYSHLVSAHLSQGRLEAARAAFATFKSLIRPDNLLDLFLYHHLSTQIALLGNEPEAASVHAQETLQTSTNLGILFHRGIAWLDTTRSALVNNDLESAERSLEEAENVAETMDSHLLAYESSLLRTCLHQRRGDEVSFRHHLQKTLQIGRENGFRTFLLWQPQCLDKLYFEALKLGLEDTYVKHIVRTHKLPPPVPILHPDRWPWQARIWTMGQFTVDIRGESLPGTQGSKPIELLKGLITLGSREVDIHCLMDMLWPEAEGDHAHESFKVTLRRLRGLLGISETVILKHNHLTLNPRLCWTDVDAFKKSLLLAEEAAGDEAIHMLENAFSLYRGPFLGQDDNPPVSRLRNKLMDRYEQLALKLGIHYEKHDPNRAIQLYKKVLAIHPALEATHRHLISCYLVTGQREHAIAAYYHCCNSLGNRELRLSEQTRRLLKIR